MNKKRRGRRSILGRNEAKGILDPYFDDLIVALNAGMEHFSKIPAAQLAHYRKRTKAGMLNDHMVRCVGQQVGEAPGVQIDDDCDGTFFVFDARLALRVKKVDGKDVTNNLKTQRQREVDFHQLEIAGVERLTFVSLGYRLDATWTQLAAAKILCKFGASNLWHIDMIEGVQATGPLIGIDDSHFDDGVDVRSARTNTEDGSA